MSATCTTEFDYQAPEEGQFISFRAGVVLTNVAIMEGGWWFGNAPDGQQGYFPSSFRTINSDAAEILTPKEGIIK
jgi:hypothetical protein